MDWDKFKQDIKDAVDEQLAEQIAAGIVVGIPRRQVTPQQARMMKPVLSSDNPSMVWNKTQGWALSHKGSMEEAIEMYENALIPAAKAALVDQQGQLLASGNKCNWPPSPYAAEWLKWCVDNLANIRKNLDEQVYNLNTGYNLWIIGEVSTGIIEGRIAVKTTYENGKPVEHFYPEKNWY